MEQEGKVRKVDRIIVEIIFAFLFAVLTMILLFGCSRSYVDRTEFRTDGTVSKRLKVTRESLLSWSEFQDVGISDPNLTVSIGRAENHSDPNSIKAAGELAGNAFKEILK